MAQLPTQFKYLQEDPLPPKMVTEALKLLGTIETPGSANNTEIVSWADETALICGSSYARWAANFYNKDSIPWCGLFCALIAARTAGGREERMPPKNYLAALAWADWGNAASINDIQVGDVVVLVREGGGHVFIALGVSSDTRYITGIGGNQGDAVTIATFDCERIYAVRRPLYKDKPQGARKYTINFGGNVETRMA
jgi:uncharacterized protein (TIGR02594 family)